MAFTEYLCFFDCHVDIDAVCIYSTCADFLIVCVGNAVALMYAFTMLALF